MSHQTAKAALVLCLLVFSACGQQQPLQSFNWITPKPTTRTICTKLSLAGVTWPLELDDLEKTGFALALNITGSFEGHSGWGNLTGNFDGQGMSMGLFQQNLGQGTLQPLLISMAENHLALMQSIFSPAHLASLLNMLKEYQSADVQMASLKKLSLLDKDTGFSALGAKEDKSVQWAVNNLFNGTQFIPQWKDEFTKLATSPEYVSLQIQTAFKYHAKAEGYFEDFGFFEIRSYLMLVDVVVQNGGFYSDSDIPDFFEFLKANPTADEKTKLEKLLELRLRHVKPQWVADVKSRKQTIINGVGKVHGSDRNLEKEYCFDRTLSFR